MSQQPPVPSPTHSRQPSLQQQALPASLAGMTSPPASDVAYAELQRLALQVQQMERHMRSQPPQADASSVVAAAAAAVAVRLPKIGPPPKFKGEMGVQAEHWLSALQQQFDYYEREFTTESAKVRFGVAYLDQGTALKWYQALSEPKPATWAAFAAALRARFSPVEASMMARVTLGRFRQGERNSVSAYTNAFQNLMTQIDDMTVTDQVFHYVNGLLPSLRVRVWEKLPKSLAEAIGYAASYEATIGFAGRAGGFARGGGYSSVGASSSASSSDSVPMDLNHIGTSVEAEETIELPRFHEEPAPRTAGAGEPALLAKLEAMEHRIAALMSASGKSSSGSSSSSSYKSGDRIPGLQSGDIARLQKENRCFRCQKVGHRKSECPNRPSKSAN